MNDVFLNGLRALAETTFPKRCATCGRSFADTAQFIGETAGLDRGIKATLDENGTPILEVFRNCPCGSTLMGTYDERRDSTPGGLARRTQFGKLIDYLASQGLSAEKARSELLKVLRGESSASLARFAPARK